MNELQSIYLESAIVPSCFHIIVFSSPTFSDQLQSRTELLIIQMNLDSPRYRTTQTLLGFAEIRINTSSAMLVQFGDAKRLVEG